MFYCSSPWGAGAGRLFLNKELGAPRTSGKFHATCLLDAVLQHLAQSHCLQGPHGNSHRGCHSLWSPQVMVPAESLIRTQGHWVIRLWQHSLHRAVAMALVRSVAFLRIAKHFLSQAHALPHSWQSGKCASMAEMFFLSPAQRWHF